MTKTTIEKVLLNGLAVIGLCAAIWCSDAVYGTAVASAKSVKQGESVVTTDTGTCGVDAKYTFKNGVMTISGTGAMADYNGDAPWQSYLGQIESVVINKGITTVGTQAFYGRELYAYGNGGSGYRRISSIKNISLASTVTTLNTRCFDAIDMTVLNIPATVKVIYDYAYSMETVESIKVASGNPNYFSKDGVLYANSKYTKTGAYELYEYPAMKKSSSYRIINGTYTISDTLLQNEYLQHIYLPATLENDSCYNAGTILQAPNLISIEADSASPYYKSINGVLFSKNGRKLIKYPEGKPGDTYVIPDTVTVISDRAFGSQYLENVTIPASVSKISGFAYTYYLKSVKFDGVSKATDISNSAFAYCQSLEQLQIPSTVTAIGDEAFRQCIAYSDVALPSGLTSIGDMAFLNSGIESIELPDTVASVGEGALAECKHLVNVELSKAMTVIEERTFATDEALRHICIPSNIKTVAANAFYYTSASFVRFESANVSLDATSFIYNHEMAISAPAGGSVQTFATSNGIKFVSLDEAPASDYVNSSAVSATDGMAYIWINKSPNADFYNIYQKRSDDSEYIKVKSGVTDDMLVVDGLNNGTKYQWKITAVNDAGESTLSSAAVIEGTPKSGVHMTIAGGLPTVTQSTKSGDVVASFDWRDIPGATSYDIYMRNRVYGTSVLIKSGLKVSHYIAGALNVSERYEYYIKINTPYDDYMPTDSEYAYIVTDTYSYSVDTVFPELPEVTSVESGGAGVVNIVWNSVSNADTYEILCYNANTGSGSYDFTSQLTAVASGITGTSYTVTGLKCSTEYKFIVRACAGQYVLAGAADDLHSVTTGSESTDISLCGIAFITDQTYNGEAVSPQIIVTNGQNILTEGTDYKAEFTNNTTVGVATATVNGTGCYNGTNSIDFNIVSNDMNRSDISYSISDISVQRYTGKSLTPLVTVKCNGGILQKGRDYTLAYQDNTSAGLAQIQITGCGSYTGVLYKTFDIRKLLNKGSKTTVSGIRYKVTSLYNRLNNAGYYGTAMIYKNVKNKAKIVIPEYIKVNGCAYKLTVVGSGAFKGSSKLSQLDVGANITAIQNNAFKGCQNLHWIWMHTHNLKSVGSNAIKNTGSMLIIDIYKADYKSYKKLFTNKTGYNKNKVKLQSVESMEHVGS